MATKIAETGQNRPLAATGEGFSDADIVAFRQRQAADLRRHNEDDIYLRRRQPYQDDVTESETFEDTHVAPEDWTNSEGETLDDFGVDVEAEEEEDDVPLAELIARRKMA